MDAFNHCVSGLANLQTQFLDAIVCYDLDRLTYQPRELEDWIDCAESRGLLLVTANGYADLGTDGGRMYARIKAAVARAEIERKGARQSRKHVQRARQGKQPKGVRPMGYATAGELIPHEADAVRAIYSVFLRGDSLHGIARALSGAQGSGEGVGAPHLPLHSRILILERNARREAEGKAPRHISEDCPWSASTVLGILRNSRYAQMSIYTPKKAQADGGRRRSWRTQILRDDAGEPIRGQRDAIVDDETWWRAQSLLDDAERVTNTSGSMKRKHLGFGLYRCGVCDTKVTGALRGYRCAQHVQRDDQGNVTVTSLMRSGAEVDAFVLKVIAKRLKKPDALRMETVVDTASTSPGIAAAISEQRAHILRAQRDYDEETIEGCDLKRIRDAAEARIAQLETERPLSGQAAGLAPLLGVDNPSEAFLNASLAVRRQVIDVLVTVTLLPQPRGKKGFNPDSVVIGWR